MGLSAMFEQLLRFSADLRIGKQGPGLSGENGLIDWQRSGMRGSCELGGQAFLVAWGLCIVMVWTSRMHLFGVGALDPNLFLCLCDTKMT